MRILIALPFFAFFFINSTAAQAKPPALEFFYVKYTGADCLAKAEKALDAAKFERKKGTYAGEDRVGVRGEYKGAIGCTGQDNVVMFAVAGPEYKDAKAYSLELQAAFNQ